MRVENLTTEFRTKAGTARAVDDMSFELNSGEILAIVGESGSGKSVTSLSIMGLVPSPHGRISGGRVAFEGRDLTDLSDREMQKLRGASLSMIFQEPMTSLNPVLSIERQMTEGIIEHLGLNAEKSAGSRPRYDASSFYPVTGATPEGISAPVLRRNVTAYHDRHCNVVQPESPDC